MTNSIVHPSSFLGFGLGLRAEHYDHILADRPKTIDWFEVISENFMDAHQGYQDFLLELRSSYTIVLHGVSLSIGSTDPLNFNYLNRLKKLADSVNPAFISDHLCWTGVNGRNTHDLLPLPYNETSLGHVVDRIKAIQDILGRQLILENPSTYIEFNSSTLPEYAFLVQMSEASGCGLLLDINNVYVSSFNHGWNAKTYINAIPAEKIAYMHLAGHKNYGTHIIDTHDSKVAEEVWQLYNYTLRTKGKISTMIEWDGNIPEFSVLIEELAKARASHAALV